MKKLFLLLLAATAFTACSKSSDEGEKETTVLIRVQNQTNVSFTAVSAALSEFGAVKPGVVTAYQRLKNVVAYPGANLVIVDQTVYVGLLYCGTPPIPMLENGKYTLEIFTDTSTYSGFNTRYKKD